ncbi:hypothetical protein ColLi_09185 [Colletotrichum liriopes]|uniref:Uncharacterized protein n=1 Tax=Colletotrichum liriopes TaxID=708192 RepID=A0AA37GSV4_9PEZI|nr:hypothetical protein ColLi_09185 [Colletotrichum liriopes]
MGNICNATNTKQSAWDPVYDVCNSPDVVYGSKNAATMGARHKASLICQWAPERLGVKFRDRAVSHGPIFDRRTSDGGVMKPQVDVGIMVRVGDHDFVAGFQLEDCSEISKR